MHGQRIDQDLSNLGKAVRRSVESRVNEGMARMKSLLLCSAWRQPAQGKPGGEATTIQTESGFISQKAGNFQKTLSPIHHLTDVSGSLAGCPFFGDNHKDSFALSCICGAAVSHFYPSLW